MLNLKCCVNIFDQWMIAEKCSPQLTWLLSNCKMFICPEQQIKQKRQGDREETVWLRSSFVRKFKSELQ